VKIIRSDNVIKFDTS